MLLERKFRKYWSHVGLKLKTNKHHNSTHHDELPLWSLSRSMGWNQRSSIGSRGSTFCGPIHGSWPRLESHLSPEPGKNKTSDPSQKNNTLEPDPAARYCRKNSWLESGRLCRLKENNFSYWSIIIICITRLAVKTPKKKMSKMLLIYFTHPHPQH